MGVFILIMALWWSSGSIAKSFSIGKVDEYMPSTNLILMVCYFPEKLGSWLLSLYELFWGKRFLVGNITRRVSWAICYIFIGRIFLANWGLMLIANLSGVLASFLGLAIFFMNIDILT